MWTVFVASNMFTAGVMFLAGALTGALLVRPEPSSGPDPVQMAIPIRYLPPARSDRRRRMMAAPTPPRPARRMLQNMPRMAARR